MRNIVITFGIICLCSLILLQMAKVAVVKSSVPVEVIIGVFAAVFLLAGILIARRPVKQVAAAQPEPKMQQVQQAVDHDKINELGISKREYEVLCEIASGLSNMEIAQKLFVSESTVKTHISNVLMKLNAKRRTEAVRVARELGIIN